MSAAVITGKAPCIRCGKERSAVRCEGCLQTFCYNHLADHRQELSKQLDEIEITRDLFRETLNQQTSDLQKHILIQQIDEWKVDSIRKIEQIAEESKTSLLQHTTEHINQLELNLSKLTEELKQIRQENDYNEADLLQLSGKLKQLAQEIEQPGYISIQRHSASPVDKISIIVASKKGTELSGNLQDANDELLVNKIKSIRMESDESDVEGQHYVTIKASQAAFEKVEKRCVKYRKSELELKRQLNTCETFIDDLQREIHDLIERLSSGSEEYRTLFRKYTVLEQRMTHNYQEEKPAARKKLKSTLTAEAEIRRCPMCDWEFPEQMTVNGKREHIEQHFD